MLPKINPTETQAWQKLTIHFLEMQANTMRAMFDEDPERFKKFSIQFEEILLDYSKNLINADTLRLLIELADECSLHEAIESMYAGQKINETEGRPVLHIALRNRGNKPVLVQGADVMPEVNRVLAQMKDFSSRLLSGAWKGYSGKPITDIVNIGIGGSTLDL